MTFRRLILACQEGVLWISHKYPKYYSTNLGIVGQHRKTSNNVLFSHTRNPNMRRPYNDAQNETGLAKTVIAS